MKEINILDIKGIRIGQAQNEEAATGCTVIISEEGAPCGLDVRGGGPASRESELLKPVAACQKIHAVVLSGGSAYGLNAADGVMQYLEEHGIGLPVGPFKVPLVCQSCIFDLGIGNGKIRPDKAMGYEACANAWPGNYQDGNFGGGTGATVGKICGKDRCMKAGIGSYAVQVGDLQVGAIVIVNAVGNVYDHKTGEMVAGVLSDDKKSIVSAEEAMFATAEPKENDYAANTTIGIILTNAKFDKTQLCKIASMTHNGFARSIRPVHTSMDGDSIYAMSVGNVETNMDLVGSLAANVMSEAILKAVQNAKTSHGVPSINELKNNR